MLSSAAENPFPDMWTSSPERGEDRGLRPASTPEGEEDDDLLSLVEVEATRPGGDDLLDGSAVAAEDGGDTDAPTGTRAKKSRSTAAEKRAVPDGAGEALAELGYRFPYGRAVLELVPDLAGLHGETFCVRLVWHRGKAVLPLFVSTPLRHIAEVQRGGQRYPIFPSQHARKRRDRVVIGGKRKTAKSPRAALRCAAVVEGRQDRLSWLWRVMATAASMAQPGSAGSDGTVAPDEVTLALPLPASKIRFLTVPGSEGRGVAVWMNDLVISIVAMPADNGKDGDGRPRLAEAGLRWDDRGVYMTLKDARLGGDGVTMRWETWAAPARTESEALTFLLKHLADAADRAQTPSTTEETAPLLNALATGSEKELMREDYFEKRGVDKLSFRPVPGKTGLLVAGEGVDAALTAWTLLGRFFMTGDDALRRRARLLANGACEYQINIDDSPHWGAVRDALRAKKFWEDVRGGTTLSVATTARIAKGLHLLHGHFNVELYSRAAMHASQWLMLKMDRDGQIEGERFTEEGPPVPGGSPWIVGETLIPLVETYRRTENDVFLKTALRIVTYLREGMAEMRLPLARATCEHLSASVEGILLVSREWENEEMIALAKRIGLAIRARRLPDGSFREPEGLIPVSPLAPTLAAARAALAISRVDTDPLWVTMALRAVRAAAKRAAAMDAAGEVVLVSDRASLCTLPTQILLGVAQRAQPAITGDQTQVDRDALSVRRGWQTFAPDPATNEYIRVYAPGTEQPVDYLALVCPVTSQVMVAVLAPAGMTAVDLFKNGRRPFVRNLLTGELDVKCDLIPLGDGSEGTIGVFLADT